MNWNKVKPWNWFKKEQGSGRGELLPVRRGDAPAGPLALLHREVDRLFDDFWRDFGLTSFPRFENVADTWLRPSLDISESAKGYTIRVEIPGVEKQDVELRLDDDTLVISGEKRREKEEEDSGYHCIERSYGAFRRLVTLPDDADRDKLSAEFRNGVLTVQVPRLAEAPASNVKRIAIN